MTTPQITRRTFLAASAAVAARPESAGPTAPSGPSHRARSAVRQDVATRRGDASITVSLTPVQDVTAIYYTITDAGRLPDTFTVWTTDLDDGRESKRLSYSLDAGESASAVAYGRLNHGFQVNVCRSDGTCLIVGPVGPAAQVGGPARGLAARPGQPGPVP